MVTRVSGEEVQTAANIAKTVNEETNVSAAFWNFDADQAKWKLVLVVPHFDKSPIFVYGAIQRALGDKSLTLDEIDAISPNDDLARAVKHVLPQVDIDSAAYPEIRSITFGDVSLDHVVVLWTSRPLTRAERKEKDRVAQETVDKRKQGT